MLSTVDDPGRRLNGVVYTPDNVAASLTRMALKRCKVPSPLILEPSAGDGAFLRALAASKQPISKIEAVDIDSEATATLHTEFPHFDIHTSEFLDFAFSHKGRKYDLIIGNPPYIRRHNFSDRFRENIDRLAIDTSYARFQLKNAWPAFVVAACAMLSEDGILAFIVPYELINVKYGEHLQAFLASRFDRVEIFVPSEKAFKDIDQDAVVVLATKRSRKQKGFQVHMVTDLGDLRPTASRKITHANPKTLAVDLKSILFDGETSELLHKLRANLQTVRDVADSSAGIVTAANAFFILREHEVRKLHLLPWARKILKKGSYLRCGPVFAEEDLVELTKKQPSFLIDFHRVGAPALSEAALSYLRCGEDLGIHNRYKSKCRKPWYRIPIVPASDGIFFKRTHSFPRICINQADILVTDTAYQVRMKDGYSIEGLCYSFYNSMTLLFSEIDGRFYGGGVLELTPNEFRGLPIVYRSPSREEFQRFEEKFPVSKQPRDADFSFADSELGYYLKLPEGQMQLLQSALQQVRSHRLRHGLRQALVSVEKL